jgi:hypothetical protein
MFLSFGLCVIVFGNFDVWAFQTQSLFSQTFKRRVECQVKEEWSVSKRGEHGWS